MVMVRQVFPSDNECTVISQGLIEAALTGNVESVADCLGKAIVDVNYNGTVNFPVKCTYTFQHEEASEEVKIEYKELKTDVMALFAVAHKGHAGHIDITWKILVS